MVGRVKLDHDNKLWGFALRRKPGKHTSAFVFLSLQPVYGAQHPPLDPRRHRLLKDTPKASSLNTKSKKPSTFHEFARSTNDAWDIDDEEDDGMFSLKQPSSSPVQSRSMPHTPCVKLIKAPADTESLPRPLDRQDSISTNLVLDRLDDESGPANGRVIKSCSDAQLNVNAEELRKHSWSGIPREVRPVTWRLLSGYLPANRERRDLVLQRKREEYFGFIEQYYNSRTDENHSTSTITSFLSGYLPANRERRDLVLQRKREEYFGFIEQYYNSRTDENHRDTYRQIHIDIPRTNPLIPLFQQPLVQEVFERILFIWAIRHPASGYVQGINDLVTPFFVAFLSEFVEEDVENFEMASLPLDTQRNIEADSFWCMSKLLDGIQDNYTFAQPGIQIKVKALEELVSRIDEDVHVHFQKCEVEYLQFAFRWMNNLLMRELPLRCTIRLWDTYQAESEGFSHFHLYVCAAFLIKWRKEILSMLDFQSLLMLLQNLPTIHWGNEEVGLLLAEAYRLKYMFADAPSHYKR
ncbi:TBC1 domain family member 22B-like [Sinocyclocheilus grahami]|uniref:TBC1 domain family member 22B-like n=1 Tax=Sinocyclocheilus grahami TaxID=75366 RepID=UPI0007ACFF0A|nr:PREDICTED: TBC1 domain family member 22B-like [Sinocyclocheilus grahami]